MSEEYQVVVVGGGATGTALVRDLAMRGVRCLLVEEGDLANGTSGRFHGLLHSGARYVVRDPLSARECSRENAVLRRIARFCVEDTGGLFCWLEGDEEDYPPRFLEGCRGAGIEVGEIAVEEARRREPLLGPRLRRVFEVPDATIEPFDLLRGCVASAEAHGARVLRYTKLVGVEVEQGRISAVMVEDRRSGERRTIGTEVLASAAGAWAGRVAALAGVRLQMAPGWGTMVILNQRVSAAVVNRCRPPSDGDIVVPVGPVSILGTTDRTMDELDRYEITAEEVRAIVAAAADMIPAAARRRILRCYAGPRPVYDPSQDRAASRALTRAHTVIDHAPAGVEGFVSIVGGKLTTCRLMAEETADVVCRKLGVTAPCRTAAEELPPPEGDRHRYLGVGDRAEANEARGGVDADLLCECEVVSRKTAEEFARGFGRARVDDLLRGLRVGMGPCQGGFCAYRAGGLLERLQPSEAPLARVEEFLDERAKGTRPILFEDAARQLALNETVYRDLFDLEHAAPVAV
jgi:glycerol-3-phosphate dehydrogenase